LNWFSRLLYELYLSSLSSLQLLPFAPSFHGKNHIFIRGVFLTAVPVEHPVPFSHTSSPLLLFFSFLITDSNRAPWYCQVAVATGNIRKEGVQPGTGSGAVFCLDFDAKIGKDDKITNKREGRGMDLIDFSKGNGLIPAIVQDAASGEVLMLAYMNEASFKQTIETGKACYYSRSRQKLWVKGETSGHVQKIREIFVDCDRDTLLLKVEQVGDAACHTGYRSCFYQRLEEGNLRPVGERIFDPKEVYGE
jgi:phosphoribosyl-AMP cyclohydrolase